MHTYQFSVPGINVADDLVGVHVRGVGEVRLEPVVLEDDGFEDILEVLVGVGIAGVDAAVLVVEVDGARDGLQRNGRRRRYLWLMCQGAKNVSGWHRIIRAWKYEGGVIRRYFRILILRQRRRRLKVT